MKNKTDDWKGYDMHELQMHRAINSIRLEIQKEKVFSHFENIKYKFSGNMTSFLFNNIGKVSKTIGIVGTLWSITRKILSWFNHK